MLSEAEQFVTTTYATRKWDHSRPG